MPRGAFPVPRHELAAAQPFAPENNPGRFVPSGNFPTPNHELAAALPYRDSGDIPQNYLRWPIGDNFSALADLSASHWSEEAFAKACSDPPAIIPVSSVEEASMLCGPRNFSEFMQTQGFRVGHEIYVDGPFYSVDWTNSAALHSAVAKVGPVKLGIFWPNSVATPERTKLSPSPAWTLCGLAPGQGQFSFATLFGYGEFMLLKTQFQEHGVRISLPGDMPGGICYAVFMRGSWGILDRQSLLNITGEAWLRSPTTIRKSRNR